MKISKTFHFEAAHHLPGHDGPCARPHGHSYKLEVVYAGDPLREIGASDDGMVVDFGHVSTVVKTLIIDRVDHQDLNKIFEFRPTAENLVQEFWRILSTLGFNAPKLHTLRLWETESAYVEVTVDG